MVEVSTAAYWELLAAAERYVELLDAGYLPRDDHCAVDELWWTQGLALNGAPAKVCVTKRAVVITVAGGVAVNSPMQHITSCEVVAGDGGNAYPATAPAALRWTVGGTSDVQITCESAAVARSIERSVALRQPGLLHGRPRAHGRSGVNASADSILADLSRLSETGVGGDFLGGGEHTGERERLAARPHATPAPTHTSLSISCETDAAAPSPEFIDINACSRSPTSATGASTVCVIVEDGARRASLSQSRARSQSLGQSVSASASASPLQEATPPQVMPHRRHSGSEAAAYAAPDASPSPRYRAGVGGAAVDEPDRPPRRRDVRALKNTSLSRSRERSERTVRGVGGKAEDGAVPQQVLPLPATPAGADEQEKNAVQKRSGEPRKTTAAAAAARSRSPPTPLPQHMLAEQTQQVHKGEGERRPQAQQAIKPGPQPAVTPERVSDADIMHQLDFEALSTQGTPAPTPGPAVSARRAREDATHHPAMERRAHVVSSDASLGEITVDVGSGEVSVVPLNGGCSAGSTAAVRGEVSDVVVVAQRRPRAAGASTGREGGGVGDDIAMELAEQTRRTPPRRSWGRTHSSPQSGRRGGEGGVAMSTSPLSPRAADARRRHSIATAVAGSKAVSSAAAAHPQPLAAREVNTPHLPATAALPSSAAHPPVSRESSPTRPPSTATDVNADAGADDATGYQTICLRPQAVRAAAHGDDGTAPTPAVSVAELLGDSGARGAAVKDTPGVDSLLRGGRGASSVAVTPPKEEQKHTAPFSAHTAKQHQLVMKESAYSSTSHDPRLHAAPPPLPSPASVDSEGCGVGAPSRDDMAAEEEKVETPHARAGVQGGREGSTPRSRSGGATTAPSPVRRLPTPVTVLHGFVSSASRSTNGGDVHPRGMVPVSSAAHLDLDHPPAEATSADRSRGAPAALEGSTGSHSGDGTHGDPRPRRITPPPPPAAAGDVGRWTPPAPQGASAGTGVGPAGTAATPSIATATATPPSSAVPSTRLGSVSGDIALAGATLSCATVGPADRGLSHPPSERRSSSVATTPDAPPPHPVGASVAGEESARWGSVSAAAQRGAAGDAPRRSASRGTSPAADADAAPLVASMRSRPPSSLASDDVEVVALSCLSGMEAVELGGAPPGPLDRAHDHDHVAATAESYPHPQTCDVDLSSKEGFSCLSPPSASAASADESAVVTPFTTTVEDMLAPPPGYPTPHEAAPGIPLATPSDGTFLNDESCGGLPTFLHATRELSPLTTTSTQQLSPDVRGPREMPAAHARQGSRGRGRLNATADTDDIDSSSNQSYTPVRAPTMPPSQSAVIRGAGALPVPASPIEHGDGAEDGGPSRARMFHPQHFHQDAGDGRVPAAVGAGISALTSSAALSSLRSTETSVGRGGGHFDAPPPPPAPAPSVVSDTAATTAAAHSDAGTSQRRALAYAGADRSGDSPPASIHRSSSPHRRASPPQSIRSASGGASVCSKGREDHRTAAASTSAPPVAPVASAAAHARPQVQSAQVTGAHAASLSQPQPQPPMHHIPLTRNIDNVAHLEGVALSVSCPGGATGTRVAVLARGDETTVVPVGGSVARMFQADAMGCNNKTMNSTATNDTTMRALPPEVEVVHALQGDHGSGEGPMPILGLDPRPNGTSVQHLSLFCEYTAPSERAAQPVHLDVSWRSSAPCAATVEANFHPGATNGTVGIAPAAEATRITDVKYSLQVLPDEAPHLGRITLHHRSEPALIRGGRRYEFLCRLKVSFRPLTPQEQVEYLRAYVPTTPEAAHLVLRKLVEEYGFANDAVHWYVRARLGREVQRRGGDRSGTLRRGDGEHVHAEFINVLQHELEGVQVRSSGRSRHSSTSCFTLQRPQHYLPIHRTAAVVVRDPPDARVTATPHLAHHYWVAAVRAVARHPQILHDCFTEYDLAAGFYVAKLCASGWWLDLTLDTWLPVATTATAAAGEPTPLPAFARAASGELWVPLLEKACAYLAGGYDALQGDGDAAGGCGSITRVLHLLTGAPCAQHEIRGRPAGALWADITSWLRDGCIVCLYATAPAAPGVPPFTATVLSARETPGGGRALLVHGSLNPLTLARTDGGGAPTDSAAALAERAVWYAPKGQAVPRGASPSADDGSPAPNAVAEFWMDYEGIFEERVYEGVAVCRVRRGWRDVRVHGELPAVEGAPDPVLNGGATTAGQRSHTSPSSSSSEPSTPTWFIAEWDTHGMAAPRQVTVQVQSATPPPPGEQPDALPRLGVVVLQCGGNNDAATATPVAVVPSADTPLGAGYADLPVTVDFTAQPDTTYLIAPCRIDTTEGRGAYAVQFVLSLLVEQETTRRRVQGHEGRCVVLREASTVELGEYVWAALCRSGVEKLASAVADGEARVQWREDTPMAAGMLLTNTTTGCAWTCRVPHPDGKATALHLPPGTSLHIRPPLVPGRWRYHDYFTEIQRSSVFLEAAGTHKSWRSPGVAELPPAALPLRDCAVQMDRRAAVQTMNTVLL